MKFDKQLLLFLALKKAETIYFSGGDWKGFVINIILEIEKELEKGNVTKELLSQSGANHRNRFLQ